MTRAASCRYVSLGQSNLYCNALSNVEDTVVQFVLSCEVNILDMTAHFARLHKLCPSENRSVKLSLRSFQQDWVHVLYVVCTDCHSSGIYTGRCCMQDKVQATWHSMS